MNKQIVNNFYFCFILLGVLILFLPLNSSKNNTTLSERELYYYQYDDTIIKIDNSYKDIIEISLTQIRILYLLVFLCIVILFCIGLVQKINNYKDFGYSLFEIFFFNKKQIVLNMLIVSILFVLFHIVFKSRYFHFLITILKNRNIVTYLTKFSFVLFVLHFFILLFSNLKMEEK